MGRGPEAVHTRKGGAGFGCVTVTVGTQQGRRGRASDAPCRGGFPRSRVDKQCQTAVLRALWHRLGLPELPLAGIQCGAHSIAAR